MTTTLLLAGDVGGTKTNVAVFSPDTGPREALARASFSSPEFDSLEDMCREFLADVHLPVRTAALGVPGPVVDGHVRTTNLPWEIDTARLTRALRLDRVTLFNDLVAMATAIPLLREEELVTISDGEAQPRGNVAVISVGTGLGHAFATWAGDALVAHPSEGGHVDFAPTSELQDGLLVFLRKRYGRVSYERVCSGVGLPNIYDFLKQVGIAEEPAWLARKLAAAEDRTPVIVDAAIGRGDELCSKTLDLFVSILGAQAGNLALTTFATGGVFVGGGIAPRVLPALRAGGFEESFEDKGRLAPLLRGIPVSLISNPDAALFGAASYGLGAR